MHLGLLAKMQKDGLVIIEENSLTIPDHASPYVRNIWMAFDMKLQQKQSETKLFSMTI